MKFDIFCKRPLDVIITSCKKLGNGSRVLHATDVSLPIEVSGTTVSLHFEKAKGDIRKVHIRGYPEEEEKGRRPLHEGVTRILNLAVEPSTGRTVGFEIADGQQLQVVLSSRQRPKVIPRIILNARW